MTSTTQGPTRGQEPPLHQIRSWQDAEINAATWMRYWGFSDAAVTGALVDRLGPETALMLPALATALVVAAGLAHRAPARQPAEPERELVAA